MISISTRHMLPFIIHLIVAFAFGYGPRSSLLQRCWWRCLCLLPGSRFLLVRLPLIPPVPQIFPNNFAGPAWLSGVGAVLSLLQLPFVYDADPKRPVNSRRSSSSLLQQSLHTG